MKHTAGKSVQILALIWDCEQIKLGFGGGKWEEP